MWLGTTVVNNTAQNSSDNLPSYPPDNHHCSDAVCWKGVKIISSAFNEFANVRFHLKPRLHRARRRASMPRDATLRDELKATRRDVITEWHDVIINCCRYLAICHGLRCHVTGKMARIIIALIWSFAASIMSPWAVFYEQREHGDHLQLPTGNTSDDVTAQPTTTPTPGVDEAEYVEYVCVQRWPSPRMERNYFLVAIFVTCYTIPLVVISVCYVLIGRRVCNRGALGDGGGQTVVQRSKV